MRPEGAFVEAGKLRPPAVHDVVMFMAEEQLTRTQVGRTAPELVYLTYSWQQFFCDKEPRVLARWSARLAHACLARSTRFAPKKRSTRFAPKKRRADLLYQP
jgi:hypothetical protein